MSWIDNSTPFDSALIQEGFDAFRKPRCSPVHTRVAEWQDLIDYLLKLSLIQLVEVMFGSQNSKIMIFTKINSFFNRIAILDFT